MDRPTTRTMLKQLKRRGPGPRQLKITLGGQLVFVTESTESPARNMRVSTDMFDAILQGVLDGEATSQEG
jgi:hypothetical protein